MFSWLRKKAKQKRVTNLASKAHPGAVTFIQRFGSALNLNVHMHSIFSDGVYTEDESGEVTFHRLPAPTLEETKKITAKIARCVHQWLDGRMRELEESDEFSEKQPLLAACYAHPLATSQLLVKGLVNP